MARRSALDREIGVRIPVPQSPDGSEILATLRGRMWRARHVLIPAAAVGAGIALSACGGDSSPETPIVAPTETQQSLDQSQFIAQADSACAEANSSIEQFAASGQGVTEADQIAQIRQGVVDQIKQLDPPSDPNLDQFLKAMADEVTAGQKIGLAVQRGEDTSQFETELDSAKSEAQTAASAYGFKECGSAITSSSSSSSGAGATAGTGGTVTPSAPSTGSSSGTAGGTAGGTSGTSGSTGSGTSGSGSGSTGGTGNSGGVGPGQ
jgi:hypothetical protein